jgi:large subunit ribosomal protein L15
MSELSKLSPPEGAVKKKKRVGRGESSGWGKTSGGGGKGQTVRSGRRKPRRGFEGGQMPLARRLPKRGFVSRNRVEYATVNLAAFEDAAEGAVIDLAWLRENGRVRKGGLLLKVLAEGEVKVKLTVRAQKFSKAAVEKITQAGGSVEVLEG